MTCIIPRTRHVRCEPVHVHISAPSQKENPAESEPGGAHEVCSLLPSSLEKDWNPVSLCPVNHKRAARSQRR
jgi:hypothetical protein